MINFILAYCKLKPSFYSSKNDIDNIKTYFRNAGGLCNISQKVANFSPKKAREIYFRYHDINGGRLNVLDTSCGFGSRMSAVILSGHNYFGFDPNRELMIKLREYRQFLQLNGFIKDKQLCKLFCRGSEECLDKLRGKIDISFTSPPYFNIEKYSDDGCASTNNYDNYDNWLRLFVLPTIKNTYRYLRPGGYAMINIKNLTRKGKQNLFDDWFNIFKNSGKFDFIETFEMQHQTKRNYSKNCASGYSPEQYKGFKEPVMVFRKKTKKNT